MSRIGNFVARRVLGFSTVVIRYKNGDVVRTRCRTFSVETKDNLLTGERASIQVKWTGMCPRPLLIGAGDIQSIWEE